MGRRGGRGKRVENCSWFCQQDVSRIREFRRTGVCPGPDRPREKEREREEGEERRGREKPIHPLPPPGRYLRVP